MRLTAIILLSACMSAGAAGYSQITLSEKNAPLEKVFTSIEKQTGYIFFYNYGLLKEAKPVSIQVSNVTLAEVLEICFMGQPFGYEIVNRTIVIREKVQKVGLEVLPPVDISGRVVDEQGNPLAGASVNVKGSSLGTTTIGNGEFRLTGVGEDAELIISYVGYVTRTISLASNPRLKSGVGGSMATIVLKMEVQNMNEVVVNKGYYTEKQKFSVGNVSKVTAKEIEKQPVQNALLALQGRVPGLLVTQTNGLPGGGVTVRIQGQNSISYGNDPLFVIDGVPYFSQLPSTGIDAILGGSGGMVGGNANGNPLSYINPTDIESIEVLKDADATSIYGSRAANGAILITTKKGKSGNMKLEVNLQKGWGQVGHKWEMLNTRQYLDMRYEALNNDGINLNTVSNTSSRYYDLKLWDTTRYTDWQKTLIGGTAEYTNIRTSVSGGSTNVQYLVSATYNKETTVFPGDYNDQKASVHFNINGTSPNQKLNMQFSGNYMFDNNQLLPTDLTNKAVVLEPNAPALYDIEGSLNWAPDTNGNSTWVNPLAETLRKYNNKTNNLVSNLMLGYKLLPGLEIRSSVGYTKLNTDDYAATPLNYSKPEDRPFLQRYAEYGYRDMSSWIVEPQITYNTTVRNGKLDILLGSTFQQNNSNTRSIAASGFNSDEVLENINAATLVVPIGQYIAQYKYNAVFGRINYNLKNKYIINLTGRRDGTSRFGSKNQFHNFGSVGGAWIFSEEEWLQKNKLLSFGKLRASYGTTGSDQIGDYRFMSLYNYWSSQGLPYQNSTGIFPDGLPNPYLEWEETRKMQIGIDLGFLRDRILLNITYARNRSSNQLLSYALPTITGFTGISRNFPATVQNTSWEFSLNSANIRGQNFEWTSSVNLTIPENKLVSFPNISSSTYNNILFIGQPLGVRREYEFAGVDPATGLYQFRDSHDNLTGSPSYPIDATSFINMAPKFYGGLKNTVSYKGFEIDFLFQFVKQLGINYFFSNGMRSPGRFIAGVSNQPITILNRWRSPRDIAPIAKYSSTASYQIGDHAFTDASYIRVKNLAISYQLPTKWQHAAHLKACKLYVQGQNLWTIANWHGLDPETQSINSLPPLRLWTVGLQVSF